MTLGEELDDFTESGRLSLALVRESVAVASGVLGGLLDMNIGRGNLHRSRVKVGSIGGGRRRLVGRRLLLLLEAGGDSLTALAPGSGRAIVGGSAAAERRERALIGHIKRARRRGRASLSRRR